MEPKREDKRKKKRKKQRQAMLAKAIPVVIAIVLIIALVGIFYGETLIESVYYTSEREDLYQYFGLVESDDVAMIMQECWQEENMTAFWAVAIIGAGILLMIACAVRKKYKEVCEKKK